MQPLTSFSIHGPPSYLLSVVEVKLLLKGSGMVAWKRKIDSKGGLDPLVVRLEKRILPCLPSLRRARGLKVGNLRRIVTSLTFGVSDVIS